MNVFLLVGQAAWIPETRAAAAMLPAPGSGYGTFAGTGARLGVTGHSLAGGGGPGRDTDIEITLNSTQFVVTINSR